MILENSIKGKWIKQAIQEIDEPDVKKHLQDLFEYTLRLEEQTEAIGKNCQECGKEIEENGVALFSYFHDTCTGIDKDTVQKIRSMDELKEKDF